MVDEAELDGLPPECWWRSRWSKSGRAQPGALADPIAPCAALEILGHEQIHDVAELTRELADFSGHRVVTLRTGAPEPPAVDDDSIEFRITRRSRYSPAQAHGIFCVRDHPARSKGIRLRSIPTADHEMAVDDAFCRAVG